LGRCREFTEPLEGVSQETDEGDGYIRVYKVVGKECKHCGRKFINMDEVEKRAK